MITFIIPTCGRHSLLDAMESLQAQTCANWKAIIVCDGFEGSADFGRFKYISIKKTGTNKGVNGAAGLVRNEGIKLVDTEWIGFLDDDDTLDKDYVKTLKKYLDYDTVLFRMIYPDGSIVPNRNNDKIQFGNVGISFCYKNKGLLFDENRIGEDLDFFNKVKGNYIVAPEIMYRVRH